MKPVDRIDITFASTFNNQYLGRYIFFMHRPKHRFLETNCVTVAKKTCYEGWTLEYKGYLMAGYYNHPAATTYTCVDEHPDTIHGGRKNENGYLFYQVEAICGSLKCPPYVRGRELVCAVCSKD